MTPDASPAYQLAERLVERFGAAAREVVAEELARLTVVEQAALAAHWPAWARGKQLPPEGEWRSWGFLTGRRFGKTLAISHWINGEVQAGRARSIGLAAQDEDNAVLLQVTGLSGLIATAPPWFKPEFWPSKGSGGILVWPNDARAYVRTPEVPGKIRGLDYDISWLSELQSWPTATREEAWSNFDLATSLGQQRIVWDSTPKRRHPLLKTLLAAHERDPERHRIVRGSLRENLALTRAYVAEMERSYGGTSKGREEIEGEVLEDADGATAEQAWINSARRPAPSRYVRGAIGIDPAVTTRAGNDETGIVVAGLGEDGQAYVRRDLTGHHAPHVWAALVLDAYQADGCDLVVVETNKGGNLLTQNLRAAARDRGLSVVLVDKAWRPHRLPGVVFVREIHSRGDKADRAQPLSTAYERGRVSHVLGADLAALEEVLTLWTPSPGARSPDRLDACVSVVTELLGLADERKREAPMPTAQGVQQIVGALRSGAGKAGGLGLAAQLARHGASRAF